MRPPPWTRLRPPAWLAPSPPAARDPSPALDGPRAAADRLRGDAPWPTADHLARDPSPALDRPRAAADGPRGDASWPTADHLARAWRAVTGRAPSTRAGDWIRATLADVAADRYRPRPVRHRDLAKPDGGVRRLSIPDVRDRVVQRAALDHFGLWLERPLSDRVHGFRPGRSPDTAVAQLLRHHAPDLAVLQVDVEQLFDRLPHAVVRAAVADADPTLCRLLDRWLAAWPTAPGVGLPQGAPLSPALANRALAAALDAPLDGLRRAGPVLDWVRYGDDLTVLCRGPAAALHCLDLIQGSLRGAGLTCKARKTELRTGALGACVGLTVLGHRLTLATRPDGARALVRDAPQ